MTEPINTAARECEEHQNDPDEWEDEPVLIESRPSGKTVVSARLPAALATELFAQAGKRGVKMSELIREAVDRLLHQSWTAGVNVTASNRIKLVTPVLGYYTQNSNPVVAPHDLASPSIVSALGEPND